MSAQEAVRLLGAFCVGAIVFPVALFGLAFRDEVLKR